MKEIEKLHNMLTEANIEHRYTELFEGNQIQIFNEKGIRIISAVQHMFSYGHKSNLIETMEKERGVKGFQTAAEVYDRIKELQQVKNE